MNICFTGCKVESWRSIELEIVQRFWKTKTCLAFQCLKPRVATPISYVGGIGVRGWLLWKLYQIIQKIKEPKICDKNKVNKMRCRINWVAYL